MRSTLTVKVPPATEPVTRDVVKQHCRIFHDSDDALIDGYLASARTMAEAYMARALLTQTLVWTLQPEDQLLPDRHFADRHPLAFPRSPVQSVTSVTALDLLGNASVISPATLPATPPALTAGYVADLAQEPATLRLGTETPLTGGRMLCGAGLQNISVEFVAGYASADKIQPPIISAVLLSTAFLYEHRGDLQVETPEAIRWLLNAYRLSWV